MSNENVVTFPGSVSAAFPARTRARDAQSALFGCEAEQRGYIVFLDIEWRKQETFLTLLARNAVRGLVDLRPRPVFDKPRFRHRDVVQYLYERDVIYLEYGLLSKYNSKLVERSRCGLQCEGEEKLNTILGRGLTLCLYDDASRAVGWLDEVRRLLQHSPSFHAEIHPRALDAAPTNVSSSGQIVT